MSNQFYSSWILTDVKLLNIYYDKKSQGIDQIGFLHWYYIILIIVAFERCLVILVC